MARIPHLSVALAFALAVAHSGCSGDDGTDAEGLAPLTGSWSPRAAEATDAGAAVREVCLDALTPLGAPVTTTCKEGDAFDEALARIDLTRCTLGVDARRALSPSAFGRAPWMSDALRAPYTFFAGARTFAKGLPELARRKTPVSALLAGTGTARTCVTLDARPLSQVLATRDLLKNVDAAAAHATLRTLPPELDLALGPIIASLADAHAVVERATADLGTAPVTLLNFALYAGGAPSAAELAAASRFDLSAVRTAAVGVALAVESADLQRFADRNLALTVATRIGDVVVRGPGDDETRPDARARPVVFHLDTGGDDTMLAPTGAAAAGQLVSILVDLGGSDSYGYVTTDKGTKTRLPADERGRLEAGRTKSRVPRQGGAVGGIGIVFEYGAGKDTYRSLAVSQGAAAFGVGVLFDEGGNDDAAAETFAQGAGLFGVGLFVDGAGDDKRRLFTRGQGYGATGGLGVALDLGGSDTYRADPGDPKLGGDLLYPADPDSYLRAPARPNHSAVQGAAEGRYDLPGATSIAAGGVGLLVDVGGDDRYEAGAFAQGVALEEGLGLLLDDAGADRYDGLAYVQGAGIHRGVGLFFDDAGADKLNVGYPVVRTMLGVGHDFGVGLFYDGGGGDVVRGPTLSLGAGSAAGLGVALTSGADDDLAADTGAAFGTTVSATARASTTVGVFVHAGTGARYRVGGKDLRRTGTTSQVDRTHDGAHELSTFADAPTGAVRLFP